MIPNAKDFKKEMDSILLSAQREGKSYIDIKSGDLHRRVGGYPGRNHRMPVCCGVMKENMKSEDQILQEPPRGQGATVVIRYKSPR